MTNILLKNEHKIILTNIFKTYCPHAEIWAYGSRLNGKAHSGSDLDLAVKNFGDDNCTIQELKTLLSDSNLPFLTDVVLFDNIPESFKTEILKNYIVIFG